MVSRLRDLLEMIKFSHTLFALPFAVLGGVLAARGPEGWHGRVQDWVGIVLCMATASRRRWPSTAWPTATSTRSIRGPRRVTFPPAA